MKNTGKTVFSVASIMILTKVITMISNLLYMAYFGVTSEINIYDYAVTVPNIIFNCIGTALNTVVIPIYLSYKSKGDQENADKFLNDIITIASVLIFLLIGIGIFLTPAIMKGAGYDNTPEQYRFAVFALRILLPVMFFHGINYILQGVLQANEQFKLPAFVSAPSALTIILYVLFLGNRFGVTGLLFATLIGFSLQPLIMVPAVRKLVYRYHFSLDYKSEAMISAAKATVPVLVSVSSYQINMLFNSTLALRFETISIMRYIQNITLVSILSIVYAIANVYFPLLTSQWASGKADEFKSSLTGILGSIAFLMIPASFGFIILRNELGDFLANWGSIGAENVRIASNMLACYGFGVCAVALKEIMDKAFYAQKDTKTPAIFGFVIMASNVILSLFFIGSLGTYSMPLSYSVSSFIGVTGLIIVMQKKVPIVNRMWMINILKCIFGAVIMSVVVVVLSHYLNRVLLGGSVMVRFIKILLPAGTGAFIYFICAFILQIPQAKQMVQTVLKRK